MGIKLPFSDEELEALADQVDELFGEQAVHEALMRVASALEAASEARDSDGAIETPEAVYTAAVKAEFRRLLRPH